MSRHDFIKKRDFNISDYILHGVFFFFYGIVKYFPAPLGNILRNVVAKPFLKKCGKVRLNEGVTIWYPYRISIGIGVTLNEWVYISGYGGVIIGNNVRIGHRVSILSSDHVIPGRKDLIRNAGLIAAPVIIGDDVFIGANATVLKGVSLGTGSVVAAGSVVTKNVPEYSIVAGNPARPIRMR